MGRSRGASGASGVPVPLTSHLSPTHSSHSWTACSQSAPATLLWFMVTPAMKPDHRVEQVKRKKWATAIGTRKKERRSLEERGERVRGASERSE
ncbi:hypothetical protein EYF80_012751 [Liparis tanakae]|uniref:Uncharacterized protein n=1 Tax=Liparis tanakae TaxID=230148 RepID=A0A4Z2IIV3_9TELE|nr:hypothetical protein EYF80_012751 [Liparis tanakae]